MGHHRSHVIRGIPKTRSLFLRADDLPFPVNTLYIILEI